MNLSTSSKFNICSLILIALEKAAFLTLSFLSAESIPTIIFGRELQNLNSAKQRGTDDVFPC